MRAVGETGLDFFRTDEATAAPCSRSRSAGTSRWPSEHGKTLVIHDRDAHDDVLRILDDEGAPDAWSSTASPATRTMARQCVDRGWVLSFAGTVTFKNAQPLRDALRVTPLDQLLVETDAPFLTPTPYRGRPNAAS